jgi:outer membrane protein OmpA-like peptidoglycan-associated protein
MRNEQRIALTSPSERRGGGGFQATPRRRLLPLIVLATACALMAQACQAVTEATREVGLPLAAAPAYKPILTPARPATRPAAESAPSAKSSALEAAPPPAFHSADPPAPEPTPKPGEATRPGNPATWGESGQLAVGRQFDPIFFNGQGTELDTVAKQRLASYAEWLRAHPQVWVTLVGHADRHASYGYAYNLGMTRALAVADYFLGAGLDARRIFTTSTGKDQPAATEKTPEADALNNRVEVMGFVPPPGVEGPQEAGLPQGAAPEPEPLPPSPAGRDLPRPQATPTR